MILAVSSQANAFPHIDFYRFNLHRSDAFRIVTVVLLLFTKLLLEFEHFSSEGPTNY